MNVAVRPFDPGQEEEAAELFAIFYEAARTGAKDHYSAAQRRAWAPSDQMPVGWANRLAQLQTLVGVVDGEIAGFMAAREDGYIDLAFVRPRWMGCGVADALYAGIADWAHRRNLPRLTTHASHLARRFFLRHGWQVDTPETVERDGEVLKRFVMSLTLSQEM